MVQYVGTCSQHFPCSDIDDGIALCGEHHPQARSTMERIWNWTEALIYKLQEEQKSQVSDMQLRLEVIPILEKRIEQMESLLYQQSHKLQTLETELRQSRKVHDCSNASTSGVGDVVTLDRLDVPPMTSLWKTAANLSASSVEDNSPKPTIEDPQIDKYLLVEGSENGCNPLLPESIASKSRDDYEGHHRSCDTVVEGNGDAVDCHGDSESTDDVLNLMIRNIPCSCSRDDVLDVIAELGFANDYIFFHMPCPGGVAGATHNLGYAFVGFKDKEVSARFAAAVTGYKFRGKRGRNSSKSCIVTPARVQGFQGTLQFCQQRKSHKNQPVFAM
jgi:hypothetical protein